MLYLIIKSRGEAKKKRSRGVSTVQREFSLLVTHTCTHSHPQEEHPGGHDCQRLTPPVCQALGQEGECLWNTVPPDLTASAGLPGGQ